MAKVLGIDPGLSGAAAIISCPYNYWKAGPLPGPLRDLRIVDKWPLRTVQAPGKGRELDTRHFRAKVVSHSPGLDAVFIERVHAMPGQGVVSMFTFGMGYGMIRASIEASLIPEIPVILVSPQRWQRGLLGYQWAKQEIAFVQKVFPEEDFRATKRCRKPHSGLVDATLIALYGFAHFEIGEPHGPLHEMFPI